MTREEKIKYCSVCKNRKLDLDRGIICSLTGDIALFDNECENLVVDQEEVARQESEKDKAPDIKGFFAFFVYWAIPISLILTLINFISSYNSADYGGSFLLKAFDVVFILFYVYFCIYTIYAFVKRKPDAVFFAKYLLIILFLTNLISLLTGNTDNGPLDNVPRILASILWSIIFYVFLCCSEDVKDRIPKETRKVKGLNKVLFILSIILPILLLIGGVVEIVAKSGGFAGVEQQIEQVCEQNRASFPSYAGNGIVSTDMRVEGKQLVMEYMNEEVTKEDVDPLMIELTRLSAEEKIRKSLANLTKQDAIFPMLVKAGYDATWQYVDSEREFLYSFSIPTESIAASLKPDYSYETSKETFAKIFDTYEKALPYELFDDCTVRGISLSDDGRTLRYDLMLNNTSNSILAGLTPSYLKDYMTELLPLMQVDVPLIVAEINGKDISFDFHADGNSMWKMSAKFTPKDYEYLLGDLTLDDEDFQ